MREIAAPPSILATGTPGGGGGQVGALGRSMEMGKLSPERQEGERVMRPKKEGHAGITIAIMNAFLIIP